MTKFLSRSFVIHSLMQTKQLTIMFTDIKGFTDKSSHKTRSELENLLSEHDRLVRPVFSRFGGRIIKTIGDAFLVVFESPTDAVLCGMEIQKILRAHNQNHINEEKLEVRVAINSGEVTLKDDDVFGEAVNITARIEGIAEANEIYFTEAVYLAMNKQEVPSAEVGYRRLKGIPNEIKVYKVVIEPPAGRNNISRVRRAEYPQEIKAGSSWHKNIFIGLGIIALSIIFKKWGFAIPAVYIYLSYSLYVIAKKTNAPRPWLALIPAINYFYCVNVGQKSNWWYILYIIPGINVIAFVLTWMSIAEMRRHPAWVGLLLLIPVVDIFILGYIAFVDRINFSLKAE